jgi:hypothetical protein
MTTLALEEKPWVLTRSLFDCVYQPRFAPSKEQEPKRHPHIHDHK